MIFGLGLFLLTFFRSKYKNYLPITKLTQDSEAYWINDILEKWKKMKRISRLNAMRRYMKHVMEWSVFGGHFFPATVSPMRFVSEGCAMNGFWRLNSIFLLNCFSIFSRFLNFF